MIFVYFFFISLLNFSASQLNLLKLFPESDQFTSITISLRNYSIFNPKGESLESVHTLSPNNTFKIDIVDIPDNVHFVVMQAHSYLINVTLSYEKNLLLGNSITGTNIGLLKLKETDSLTFYLNYNQSLEGLDVMLATQAYGIDAPIPGGCNMEFPVEVSPFLQTIYNDAIVEVDFAPAASPVIPSLNFLPYQSSECNIKSPSIQYKMYHQYFPERDFSKITYFNILKSMMTEDRILKSSHLVQDKFIFSPLRKIFASYPGTGNAFVVISKFKNNSAIYVPSFTYACNDLKENITCVVLTTTFSKVLCASILFIGLFACFFGHYFFKIELFLFGYLTGGIITYILVSILFGKSFALSLSVSIGFFISVLELLAQGIFGLPIISVTLASLTFGFFLSSVIFYFIIEYVESLILDINYWGIFIGIMIACPIWMIHLAEKANIIVCAVLGSYTAVVSIDYYLGSNLRYIVLNTIRRATDEKFKWATTGPPFQKKDILLSIMWIILSFLGIVIQRRLTKNKPPYPPPNNPIKSVFRRLSGPPPLNEPSENSPLLASHTI